MAWTVFEGLSATVTAIPAGVLVSCRPRTESASVSRFERVLPALLMQLEDIEAVSRPSATDWCIPYEQFVDLESRGVEAFAGICKWSPLTLELESIRWLGSPDFRYRYRFFRGSTPAAVEREGCFISVRGEVFRLDSDTFRLIQAVDKYNGMTAEQRTDNALFQFSEIKGLASAVGAKLDKYLAAERVLLPSRLGVDIVPEPGDRISFIPKIEGISQDAMTRAFFASDDIESVYALDDENGGRIRVIFDEHQQEVLKRIQRIRHLGGRAKASVMRDPSSVLDGLSAAVDFTFGPRVKGVGDFPFTARAYVDARTGIFDGVGKANNNCEYGIECRYADGTSERVRFSTRKELAEFRNKVSDAQSRGLESVDLHGKTLTLDPQLQRSLEELDAIKPKGRDQPREPRTSGKYVLIYTNESELEYQSVNDGSPETPSPSLPRAFVAEPKSHQVTGYRWLMTNHQLSRSGCLLADDMGLGKTLQVLLFLASLIESGRLSAENGGAELPSWNPILLVAPVILIDNGTWQADIQKFFDADGTLFEPMLALHGTTLKRFRNPDIEGRETVLGQPALRLDELKRFKLIITNYETVVNYQHSFARMPWSIVVTDEAQEYKTPSTKVSHALKALSAQFRIACTGTPVETQLFDIWNLFDFLQPGPLLGSAGDFRRNYEPSTHEVKLPELKQRLKLGMPDAHLLRRNKEDVLDLPPKHEHYLSSDLSAAQINWHVDLLSRRSGSTKESHPFSILHSLMKVYQHPLLMSPLESPTSDAAIRACPKLASVISCLQEIRDKSEKALIFTRSIDMQQILALTLEHIFGFRVNIVNGSSGSDGRRNVGNTRRAIVETFRKSVGFNVLILSPDVAGIGLTITEANHVVHYGRWWNPAKESQATDRVYRIGQAKPVHVYYPVAKHPTGEFASFDEKLDALLKLRKQLAYDFLAPTAGEEDLQKELLESLGVSGQVVPPQQIITVENLADLTWDRFESLIALIERKYGRDVWLSPKSGDGGIDVIARIGSTVRLIQCKHTQWTTAVDGDTVAELINSFDAFRANLEVSGFTFKPVLITNASIPRRVLDVAVPRDIEVIGVTSFAAYLGGLQCSRGEVEDMERQRYASLPRMKQDLKMSLRGRAAGAMA